MIGREEASRIIQSAWPSVLASPNAFDEVVPLTEFRSEDDLPGKPPRKWPHKRTSKMKQVIF